MLRDNILQQQFHNDVIHDVTTFLQQKNVHEKLYQFETILRKVDTDIVRKERENYIDKQETMMALQKVSHNNNNNNISPTDILQYQAYHNMLQKKIQLQQDIVQLEGDIVQLQQTDEISLLLLQQKPQTLEESELTTTTNTTNTTVADDVVHHLHVELEQTADLCAMIR